MTLQKKPADNIRVFISSTFNDMQAERDQLVKKTFPILRSHCEKAGLSFTEVDLRWGITNEEAADDKVLSICLQEIEQSRPYFIGILGDRYGWIPDSFPENLSDSEPWLAREKGKSVTELEILNGVLNNPDMAGYAFFYFRKEGVDAAKALDADKLILLKERIRKSGFPVKEGFTSPEELGLWIETDLKNIIDPQLVALDNMNDIQLSEMEAESSLKTQSAFFVTPKEQFKQLDNFVSKKDNEVSTMILEGEVGMGKYSTLSNWYLQRKEQDPNHMLLFYPTRAGGNFSDVDFMLRFLIFQMQGQSPDFQAPPEDANRYLLLGHFINAITKTALDRQCTIIIPAIDQLSDAQAGRGVIWLPKQFPEGVKIIVSASNPEIIQHFYYLQAERLLPKKLTNDNIIEFTQQFLNQYRKKLSPSLIQKMAESQLTAIPINLMIILEELRIFGNHDKLEDSLTEYLTATNTKDLYLKVIDRWESDYNFDNNELVKTTLSCMYLTIAGLSEFEIRSIVGDDSLLPQAYWSPLYLAMSKWLLRVKGNLKIGNVLFAEAVFEKYLTNPNNIVHAHQLTAQYFHNRMQKNKPGAREFTELPNALLNGQDYKGFVNFYSNRETLKEAWKYSNSLVTQYFSMPQKLGNGHFLDIVDNEIRENSDYERLQKEDPEYLIAIAEILQTMGHNKDAKMFWNMITGVGQQNNNDEQFELGLSKLAYMEMISGNIDKASNFYNHLLQHYDQKSDQEGIFSTYHNLGLCFQAKEDNLTALKYFAKAAEYFGEKQDMPRLLTAIINCSNAYERIEKYEEADKYLNFAETICKQLGDNVTLAIIYDEKATLLRIDKKYDQALEFHNRAINIFSTLNHVNKHIVSLALRGKTNIEMLNISEGVQDYIYSIQRCISRDMNQVKDEVIHMLEDSMKWNVAVWLGTNHKDFLDELFYELYEYKTIESGMFEPAFKAFYEVMEKSIAFANAIDKENKSEE